MVRAAIVGAGVTGLVNARVLRSVGVEVVVLESRPDVGGVWSATRGYPGLRIQNDKRSYSLSDFPMPEDYPEHPSRAQLQAYFAAYSRRHGLDDVIRLSTTVTRAEYDATESRWRISADGPDGEVRETVDWLILANGTLSTPRTPAFEGTDLFLGAGGRVVEPGELGDSVDFTGRRVVLLGYGKSATDIAVAAAHQAVAVTVVARSAPWKLPPRIGPISFQHIVLSRLGEHLLWAPHRTLLGALLKRLDTGLRLTYRAALTARLRNQLGLRHRGLVPSGSLQDVSHLTTPGFDRAVDEGRVDLRVGGGITGLGSEDGTPVVRLSDGHALRADLLVVATGYRTDVAFLDEVTQALLHDDHGRMPLWRHTVPEQAPGLLFAGWINSFRSPIASELQAIWIAAYLHGAVRTGRRRSERGRRRSSRSAAPTGLSIVEQDGWLHDAGLSMPWRVVAAELLRPLDPAAYAGLHERLRARIAGRSAAEHAHPLPAPVRARGRGRGRELRRSAAPEPVDRPADASRRGRRRHD